MNFNRIIVQKWTEAKILVDLSYYQLKGKIISQRRCLGTEVSRNEMFPQNRETDLTASKVSGAGCPPTPLDIFLSTVFRMTFLTGHSSYYKSGNTEKAPHPALLDKPIRLGSLTATILYLVITQNSPLICICLNLFFFHILHRFWQDA